MTKKALLVLAFLAIALAPGFAGARTVQFIDTWGGCTIAPEYNWASACSILGAAYPSLTCTCTPAVPAAPTSGACLWVHQLPTATYAPATFTAVRTALAAPAATGMRAIVESEWSTGFDFYNVNANAIVTGLLAPIPGGTMNAQTGIFCYDCNGCGSAFEAENGATTCQIFDGPGPAAGCGTGGGAITSFNCAAAGCLLAPTSPGAVVCDSPADARLTVEKSVPFGANPNGELYHIADINWAAGCGYQTVLPNMNMLINAGINCCGVAQGNNEAKLDKIEGKLDKLEPKVDKIEPKLDRAETKLDNLAAAVARLEAKLDKLAEDVRRKFCVLIRTANTPEGQQCASDPVVVDNCGTTFQWNSVSTGGPQPDPAPGSCSGVQY